MLWFAGPGPAAGHASQDIFEQGLETLVLACWLYPSIIPLAWAKEVRSSKGTEISPNPDQRNDGESSYRGCPKLHYLLYLPFLLLGIFYSFFLYFLPFTFFLNFLVSCLSFAFCD
jgi:hypothetical protein